MSDATPSFFTGTRYTAKVMRQARQDDFHGFPETVRAFEASGSISRERGGDGVLREILRIPSTYRGRSGVLEFVKEPNGDINHRYFRADP